MDTAVALVESYLNVNGYFTVVEYPVLEGSRRGPARSVTDLDVLAGRFSRAVHHWHTVPMHYGASGLIRVGCGLMGSQFPGAQNKVRVMACGD